MKLILLSVIILASGLFGDIQGFKIKTSKDIVSIILSFDKPFAKEAVHSRIKDTNIILIGDMASFKKNTQAINKDFLKNIQFVNLNDSTNILFSSKVPLLVNFAKTSNMLELTINISHNKNTLPLIQTNKQKDIHLKEESIGYGSYLFSFFIVAVILLVYWILRMKVLKMPSSNYSNYRVLFQKSLDVRVKISLVAIEDKKYLILTGVNHSLLLDTFYDNITQEEFNDMVNKDYLSSVNKTKQA